MGQAAFLSYELGILSLHFTRPYAPVMKPRAYLDELAAYGSETAVYIKKYLTYRLELFRLDATEKLVKLAWVASQAIILGGLVLLALITLSFSLAWWLGGILGSASLGFLAVGLCELLLAVGFLRFGRCMLRKRIERMVIESAFGEEDEA